ncbi:ROK family protein [Nocardia sp. NPDC004722]
MPSGVNLAPAHDTTPAAHPLSDDGGDFAVIGIDFGGTKTEIALSRADGEVIERVRLETRADAGPDQILTRAGEVVRQLEEAEGRNGRTVAGLGAVCPGIIRHDRIQLTPNLPGWEGLSLAARLSYEFGAPVVAVANDVRAAAMAELRFGALRGVETGIYVNLGTGLSAALVADGKVVAGANQAAGEIGYMNPGTAPIDAVAKGAAPLEELIGGAGLTRRASELLGGPVTGSELFARSDAAARALVADALRTVAITLGNLAAFVDPDRIVLGGGMARALHARLPELTEMVCAATPFPLEIHAAHFHGDASVRGAVALAIDAVRDEAVPQAVH